MLPCQISRLRPRGTLQRDIFLGITLSNELATDPPIPGYLGRAVFHLFSAPPNVFQTSLPAPASLAARTIMTSVNAGTVVSEGQLTSTWDSESTCAFNMADLQSVSAVVSQNGSAIGSGAISISAMVAAVVTEIKNAHYAVTGTGTLSFYGPAELSLGVSASLQNYTATVTGNASITLTVLAGVLTLNGQALPAGTYTITTDSATLSGSGTMSSPNFSGSASITSTNGTINLGPGSGTLSVGGKPLDPTDETTLDGYTGTINVSSSGDGTDSVSLSGNAGNVLQVTTSPTTLTTDQNTPVTFATNVQTSLADTYNLTANAPTGWTVSIDSSGNVTVTPAPGLQSGTYPIQIIAQSQTDPNLVAQTTVDVTITPTQPGINFSVASDPMFTVPFNGAQLPTAFRATIQNLGPAGDTYNLTFSNVPSGFSIVDSGTSVTVPAGATGILGIYLVPNTGQPIPPPGTQLSFTVTATSTTDSSITQTQTETFTVPDIDAVTVSASPTAVSTIPGGPVTDTLTITNVGNVEEDNIALTDTLPSGLTLAGLATVSLAVGQSTTETITLTPDASTPLNSTLDATITATFGPSASPDTQTVQIPVQVVAPGVEAISGAAVAAGQAGNTALGNQLNDLSIALTNLYQDPTDPVANGQATASLDSLISQVTNDPFLASFAPGLTTARAAIANATSAADISTALTNLGNSRAALAQGISDEAAHSFTLGLMTTYQHALPKTPAEFQIDRANTGSQTTTYDLSVAGLPANVSSSLSLTSVTLAPGQAIAGGTNGVTLSLTETGDALFATGFTITATAEGACWRSPTPPRARLSLRDHVPPGRRGHRGHDRGPSSRSRDNRVLGSSQMAV